MTHISRPIQIALAAAVLFVGVWFVALRGHSSGTESSGSGSSAPAAASPSPSSSSQSAPGGGTPASKGHIYHGSAPGVEGLSRAIQRAQGAVAQSQQNAQQLQQKSAEASNGTQPQGAQGQTQQSQAQGAQHSQSQAQQQTQAGQRSQTHRAQGQPRTESKAAPAPSKAANGVPAMQALVEGELARGKTVAVLFWNPKGAVDATVRRELRAAERSSHGRLAIHVALAREVGSFGSFTHTVQVFSTPTILLIDRHGKTSSISGLTDAFSIGQAIRELKQAK